MFWGIWIAFYINITCGLALISQEKDILHDVLRAFPQYANLSPAKFAAAISGIIGWCSPWTPCSTRLAAWASPHSPTT